MAIKLGDKARDTISGLEGVAIGRFEYLHGCVRMEIQPEGHKDGKRFDSFIVDEPQLVLLQPSTAPAPDPRGGPRNDPAPKASPAR